MIKYEVCVEVAKLAFAGELETRRDEIPYTIIPGNTPQWRCCVYREREIVRPESKPGRRPSGDRNKGKQKYCTGAAGCLRRLSYQPFQRYKQLSDVYG